MVMPWKNGGGVTREVIRFPPDSDLDNFAWRISVATVGVAGPFSTFPGVDRSLALIGGELLVSRQSKPFTLTSKAPIFEFAGEERVDSSLTAGPATDFNVMTRRQQHTHKLICIAVSGQLRVPAPHLNHINVVYVIRGGLNIHHPTQVTARLTPGDAVLLTTPDDELILSAADAEVMLVNIGKVAEL